MNDYVQKPDMRILMVLARLCTKFDKLYCYPSMETIAELVFKFTGRAISERTMCRHLGALERDGWLKRQRRHERDINGELQLHSSLYMLTKRTVTWMRSLGTKLWIWSAERVKSLIHIALPLVAETLAQETKSNLHRAAHAPPIR